MTVTVHSTDAFVSVQGGIRCRVWEGETESGVKVQMLVPRLAAIAAQDQSEFERDLKEHKAPEMPLSFPLRMVL